MKYYSTGCSVIKYQPPEQIPKIKLSIGKKRKERKDAVVGVEGWGSWGGGSVLQELLLYRKVFLHSSPAV